MCASDYASDALCQLGAIQDLLAAMRRDPKNVGLVATCCNALWGLTILGKPHSLRGPPKTECGCLRGVVIENVQG